MLAVPTDGLQVEYQFLLHDGQKWTTLQEYSTDQRYFWTPQIPGTYSLKVTAREIGKKVEIFQKIGYTISAVPALSAVKFTTEPESPQLTQTKIELIATTTGGVNIEYQFLLFDGENWTVLRDFAGEEFCNWIPPNAGFFTLKVNAREVGTTESVSREMVYSIGAPLALSGVVLSTDNFFPIVNNEVTLTAAPNGGGSVEYSFMVDDGGGWKTLRGYSTVPTVKLDFKKSGDLFAEGFGA